MASQEPKKDNKSVDVKITASASSDEIPSNILKDLNQIVTSVIEKKPKEELKISTTTVTQNEKPKEEPKISTTTVEKKKEDEKPKEELKISTNTIEKKKEDDKPVLASEPPKPEIKSKKKKKPNEIDYLIEDDIIPNQMFCCVSFLSPEGVKNCSLRGVKVRGWFPNEELAEKYATEVRKKEPYFHVFVGPVGKWLPWDPDPNTCHDQNYMEKELNDLMKEYLKSQEQAKRHHDFRKEQMLEKHFNDERTKKMHEKLEKKLEEKKAEKADEKKSEPLSFGSVKECDEKLKQLNEEEKKIKEERDKLQKILIANRPHNEKTDQVYDKLQKGFGKKGKK
jgi:hypothetical protein